MAQYFHFERLIRKYSTEFTAIVPSDGKYDDSGEWVQGEPSEQKMTGAIISHRLNKIFKSEGTLTEQDRILYTLAPLDKSLTGATVIHGGNKYSIGSLNENAEFTGVYSYTLKFVSAFNGEGGT